MVVFVVDCEREGQLFVIRMGSAFSRFKIERETYLPANPLREAEYSPEETGNFGNLTEIAPEKLGVGVAKISGALISIKDKQVIKGSGFLISSNLVLTVAHNIFDI